MTKINKIGSNLRIRLPDNYNLKDYNKQIIQESVKRFAACQQHELIYEQNLLADMLYYGYEPPTRWQKFKIRIKNVKQRCKDVWTIVSGGDVHRNCGY